MDFKIQKISIGEELFPIALKQIKNPPQELYYAGKLLTEENCIAVVGARSCSKYGEEACLKIGTELAENGITIVSGLARGIDSFAHSAATKADKRTIAVLGTSLDEKNFYPKENLILAKNIINNNGLLLSEHPPGVKTRPYDFSLRNRLIAGLSLGVVVVEAKEKSGSLITAEYGREQGKKIFAVPGSIFSKNSLGCHKLIKNGAILAENADDILKSVLPNYLPLNYKSGKEVKGDTPEEEIILSALKEEALHIEDIIRKSNMPAGEAMALISLLEIKNKIIDLGENMYCLNRK
ncbi:MAG: DNA-processing protein DprA [Candidatus Pacebacteria bacterium]|nr:DNA-processing protein DprA [Candidatus Paceibacterota bacterium]